jgi:hypothetical protein
VSEVCPRCIAEVDKARLDAAALGLSQEQLNAVLLRSHDSGTHLKCLPGRGFKVVRPKEHEQHSEH